jgi:PAS domain S-box-containing protein
MFVLYSTLLSLFRSAQHVEQDLLYKKLLRATGNDFHMRSALRSLAAILALAAVYFCAGKLGLSLAYIHASASAVWPPAGLALAALLLWGYRLWPGIFLGAFLVNITTQGSVATTFGIASGNTLEALLGAWAINRFANGAKAFERARNIFKFILLAPILSTVVSATLGVTSLTLGGFAPWDQYLPIWFTWWLGDAVGGLIVAPLLVIWMTQPYPQLKAGRIVEAADLLLFLILVTCLMFVLEAPLSSEYMMVLPLLWAAFRFGERGAVTCAFIMSGIALVGTLNGVGPFAYANPNESLLHLQSFMGTIAITALVLASVISEGRRAEWRLEVQDAVSRILAESPALKEAVSKIVQVLCERAGWDLGAVWNMDRAGNELRYFEVWHMPSVHVPQFMAATREGRFGRGTGLPGQVWSTGKAAWIPDVATDSNFRRAPASIEEGLHSAFGFPIKLGNKTLGVIECYSREVREPDDSFLQMVSDIGGQLGQFMERKRAEELLLHSEERLRGLVETAVDGIITIDERGTMNTVNPAAERIFGYPAAEMVGENVRMLMPNPYQRDHDSYIGNYLRTGQRKIIGIGREVEGRRKDGTIFPLDLAVSEIHVGDRRMFTGIVRDITERKLADELLRQAKNDLIKANEELERRVQERTADLKQANAALLRTIDEQKKLEAQLRQAQKMESIGTLAGGIAHDFNNILNIIQGYAQLIAVEPLTEEQINKSLNTIDEQIKRGASMVRQLLTVARKTETHLAPVNANDFVSTVSELIQQSFPKTIAVALDLHPALPPVMADSNQLSQALLNICVNARDAMPAGGTITVRTEKIDENKLRELRREADRESYVSIVISDTGIGMEEKVRARIFEPFFTTKGIGEGTGLGLAIAYGIVKEHNGFIDVESEPGLGTTFRIYLPVLRTEGKSAVHEIMRKEAAGQKYADGRGTVLVVEDEEAMVRLLIEALSKAGYQTLTAMDGEEAIDLYLRHKDEIDIVVLDLGLPKVTGYDVIHKLNEQNPGVSIIITTGYLQPELKSELLRAGVKDCIYKPYLVHDLVEKLGSLIERSRTSSKTIPYN